MTEERKALTLGIQVSRLSSLADQGASLTLNSTRELDEETFIELAKLYKSKATGWMILVLDLEDAKSVEVPEGPAKKQKRKSKKEPTKSELLRQAIWTNWYRHTTRTEDEEIYYENRMDYYRQMEEERYDGPPPDDDYGQYEEF